MTMTNGKKKETRDGLTWMYFHIFVNQKTTLPSVQMIFMATKALFLYVDMAKMNYYKRPRHSYRPVLLKVSTTVPIIIIPSRQVLDQGH